jgi:hypothetical protein
VTLSQELSHSFLVASISGNYCSLLVICKLSNLGSSHTLSKTPPKTSMHSDLCKSSLRSTWRNLRTTSRCSSKANPHRCDFAIDNNPVNALLPPQSWTSRRKQLRPAFDMIISGTVRSYPDVKAILSYVRGTIPHVVGRAASLLTCSTGLTVAITEDILQDAKRFYFQLTLSSTSQTFGTLLTNFPNDYVMYGRDFPFAPPVAMISLGKALDAAYKIDDETRSRIYERNALELFPRYIPLDLGSKAIQPKS